MNTTMPANSGSQKEREFLKKHELADEFGVTSRTITDWHAIGLPVIRMSTRLNLYHLPSCRAWVLKRQVQIISAGSSK